MIEYVFSTYLLMVNFHLPHIMLWRTCCHYRCALWACSQVGIWPFGTRWNRPTKIVNSEMAVSRKDPWDYARQMWVFPKIVVPQNGWFIMENPIKIDDLGGIPIFGNTRVKYNIKLLLFFRGRNCKSRDTGNSFSRTRTANLPEKWNQSCMSKKYNSKKTMSSRNKKNLRPWGSWRFEYQVQHLGRVQIQSLKVFYCN